MENNYTIKMTPKAADDLGNIYIYISEELATKGVISTYDIIIDLSRHVEAIVKIEKL